MSHDSKTETGESRPVVLVLMGGPDPEREVSIASGREVAAALRASGRFAVRDELIDRPSVQELAALGGDVVFPALHGRWGEGGALQAHLEEIGVPYVGAGPEAAALAMDKLRTKRLAEALGVPTPAAQELHAGEPCSIPAPLVLKPIADGSSVDLAICHDEVDVAAARQRLHARRTRLMAEPFVAGREVTAGVVLDRVLPLIEIVPADGVYDYAAKYERDDTGYVIEPDLPDGVADACRRWALLLCRELGARDVARVDFMVDERGPWVLEANTMPGFTTHSLVPMAAAAAGQPMPELCASLVDAALRAANGS